MNFPSSFPRNDAVEEGSSDYFLLSGLTKGATYELAVQSATGKSLWSTLCGDLWCTDIRQSAYSLLDGDVKRGSMIAAASSVYLRVQDTSGIGDGYSLNITDTTLMFPGSFPYEQGLSGYQSRWNQVQGLVPGTSYLVTAAGAGGTNFSLQVDDSDGSTLLCVKVGSATTETCTVTPTGSSLYVATGSETALGQGGTLTIVAQPVP